MSPGNHFHEDETTGPDPKSDSYPPELYEGIGIVLRNEENGNSLELANWLTTHPELANDLAQFLVQQKGVRSAAANDLLAKSETKGIQDSTGFTIGGFELTEEIGRGGMGVVYRAFDKVLKRPVAIKRIIHGNLVSPTEKARFRFEAEAVAKLQHPAVVPILTFGEVEGLPFLVMPMMEGGSLAQKLRNLGPDRCLPPREAAKLIREVALGVDHAHQRGLLHRDLKPANILLDHKNQPHIADFGLAMTLETNFSLSMTGSLTGTAAYMAPEQVLGQKPLTTSVDIHALGAILYELLIGEPPFGRGEWLSTIQKVRDDVPRPIRLIRREVPRDLELISMRCLEKQPDDRYPSALALAEDLGRYLEGDPLTLRQKKWFDGTRRALARRRETLSMTTWPGCFLGAGVMVIVHGTIQVLVWNKSPDWLAFATLLGMLLGWVGLYWWFLVVRGQLLSPVERLSAGIQAGNILACLMLLWINVYQWGWNIVPSYPTLTIILGLGLFAHGATHWGQLYLAGGALMLLGGLFPFVPQTQWPLTHGLVMAIVLSWVGMRLRAFDLEAHSHHEQSLRSGNPGP